MELTLLMPGASIPRKRYSHRVKFPVTREKIFLGHAGVCPLPRRVAEAIRDYATQTTLGDQETLGPALRLQETRGLAARWTAAFVAALRVRIAVSALA